LRKSNLDTYWFISPASPQENKPIGTSILQLSVVDQDSSHNGPPFDFRILTGNEGGEFLLEKDGTLVANQVFRRDLAPQYVIQIQVRKEHLGLR